MHNSMHGGIYCMHGLMHAVHCHCICDGQIQQVLRVHILLESVSKLTQWSITMLFVVYHVYHVVYHVV